MKRTLFSRAAAIAALSAVAISPALAQTTSVTRLIVGFPAGGAVDTIARTFAEYARQAAGTTLIVENRAGASGQISLDVLKNAPADGLTLLIAPASLIELAPIVMPTMKLDPVKDLTAVGSVAEYGFGVAAGPASGAKDIEAYKSWAKAHPSASSFASPGQGTPQQFLGAQLQKALGVDLVHIPYKGGAPAINDVMGGQIPLIISTEQLLVPYEGQGKMNTLFITSKTRNPLMPNVPTAKEAGLPQLEAVDWFGAFVKAGTDTEKVNLWKARVEKVLKSPGYIAAMKRLGYGVPRQQAADFAAEVDKERTIWADRVKLTNFKPAQ